MVKLNTRFIISASFKAVAALLGLLFVTCLVIGAFGCTSAGFNEESKSKESTGMQSGDAPYVPWWAECEHDGRGK